MMILFPPPSRSGYGRTRCSVAFLAGLCGLLTVISRPAAGQAQQVQPQSEALAPTSGTSGHKLVLCTNGTVTGWGDNSAGQLGGNPSYLPTPATVRLTLPVSVVRVANVSQSSFAMLANGTLWAWGSNTDGQLGVGSSTAATAAAMQVPGIAQVIAVSGGFFHTVALCADGTVWSWGKRSDGALGTGLGGAATQYLPQQITALSNIRAIACGDHFSMALDASGHLWSWGRGGDGELGIGQPAGSPPQATPVQVALNNVQQIDATNVRAAALCTDGTVWNWGNNAGGQLGLGNTAYTNKPAQVGAGTITDAVWVAMNTQATMAVRPTGSTYVWGSNSYGSLGIPSPSFAPLPTAGPTFTPNAQISGQGSLFSSLEGTGAVQTWGLSPLGYTPSNPGPAGCSYKPTTPAGVCRAVPTASFPACGPQRAYYQNTGATYCAALHGNFASPAEIGTYGVSTVIDLSQPPYSGTVMFDGSYHVRGNVRLINGKFSLQDNTVFYVDSDNGQAANAPPPHHTLTTIEVKNATLDLQAATLQASCPDRWGGVALMGSAQLYTGAIRRDGSVRCVIRDAKTGVYCYTSDCTVANTNKYYLRQTDFINNDTGLYDLAKGTAQLDEGARLCTFQDGQVGIQFEYFDHFGSIVYGGDYNKASFDANTFKNLEFGIIGQAGALHVTNNTFTDNYLAAINLEATAATSGKIYHNSIVVPAAWPAALVAQFPAGYAPYSHGINSHGQVEITANTIVGATTTPAANNVQQVGMSLSGNCKVHDGNSLRYLDEGLTVVTSDNFGGSNQYINITGNTFEENVTGLTFIGYHWNGYPTYPMQLTLRCNTFSSTQPNGIGVWVKAGTPFPSDLGSLSAPNGNRFNGISDVKKRFVYDATSLFKYYRYNSTQEELGDPSGNAIYTYSRRISVAIANSSSNASATGACGNSTTPGVYARSVAAPQDPATPGAISPLTSIQLSEAYPNPASETVSFTYTLPANSASAELVLRDLLGREVARQPLAERTGEVCVAVQHLPAGFYTGALEVAGRRQLNHKLTITH